MRLTRRPTIRRARRGVRSALHWLAAPLRLVAAFALFVLKAH